MKKIALFILITISCIGNSALLGSYFTYQGELLDSTGQPANGNHDFEIKLYSVENGGTVILVQEAFVVGVDKGIFTFNVDFGDLTFSGDERWVEIGVKPSGLGSYTTMTPRQLITNSPYTIHAQFVGTDGVHTNALRDGAVTTTKIHNLAVTTGKLADGAVNSAKILNNSITSNDIALGGVQSINILDATITGSDISNSTITQVQMAADSISHFQLQTDSVRSSEIKDGEIVAADINNNSVQQRISNACPAGESIQSVSNTGLATCISVGGASGWGLTGNAGTTPGTNFIGTTDNKNLEFKVNGITAMKLVTADSAGDTTPNIIGGASSNSINSNISASIIASGKNNQMNPNSSASGSVIAGGEDNSISGNGSTSYSNISGGSQNSITDGSKSTISGGTLNSITSTFSTISGGAQNKASGAWSVVPGGSNNESGGNTSFAGGSFAVVRNSTTVGGGDTDGDENTFIWSQTGVTSTGPNQVLFQATGGFGIGTNAPSSPLHVKGQGTSNGSTVGSNEVVLMVEPLSSSGNVAVVVNRPSGGEESAFIFSSADTPEFDIRTSSTRSGYLEFNSYISGAKQTLMAYDYFSLPTISEIEMSAHVIPTTTNTYNLGTSSLRWATIYSQNPLNSLSDKRMKKDIKDIDYGLAEILAMRPVTYYWKNGNDEHLNLGLIAQEVETLVPEVVQIADDKTQTRSMSYSELIPVLIKATQEQQTLIEQQNKQIRELKSMVELLINKPSV